MKETRAKKCIELYGGMFNVNYDRKTYKNIESILKCHKKYLKNRDMFNFGVMGKDSIEKVIPYVYRNFLGKEPIHQNVINRLLMQILTDEKTEDILYDTLENIKLFKLSDPTDDEVDLGKLYYDILRELYFTQEDVTNLQVYLKLELDSHKFSYRKEEAVMLFGIYFFQRCLECIDDWPGMMEKIQKEEGRFDLLLGYGN